MPTATSTILHKHFRGKNAPIKALIIECKSLYEAALKKITGVEFYHIPNHNYSSLSGLDFDVIISQCKHTHYDKLLPLSNILHLPIVSLDCNLPNNQEDLVKGIQQKAHTHIFSHSTINQAWQVPHGKVIYEPIDLLPFNENKIYGTVFVDVDKATLQLGQQLSQIVPIAQIPQDNKELDHFVECGLFVNLASPNPDVLVRIRKAMSAGCCVASWGHPLFKEYILPSYNGFTFDHPDQLVQQLQTLRAKGAEEIKRMGKASQSLIKTKFSFTRFEKEWRRILTEASNSTFLGV